MSIKDKEKWNKKYEQNPKLIEKREPSFFVKKYATTINGLNVLDLACGVGRNALFLEELGFRVDAVDISTKALSILNSRSKGLINIIEADLDDFKPKKSYDFIIKCNFLDRRLINRTKDALNSGGVYIIETYIEDKNNEKKDSNPNFLLKKGELLDIFNNGFEILEYKTFWNDSSEIYKMRKAAIIARKL